MGCLNRMLVLDGTLSKKELQKRKLFFVMNAIILAFTFFFNIIVLERLRQNPIAFIGQMVNLVTAGGAVLLVVFKVPLTNRRVVCVAYGYALGVFAGDLAARAGVSEAVWPMLVLLVDFMLVMQVGARYCFGLVCFTVAWLVLMAMEERLRFGLFDIPGTVAEDIRWSRLQKTVDCQVPPCERDGVSWMVLSIQVFVVDFVATRGFAREILKEQECMQRTISAVQEIASLLAGYDVEQVAVLLETHEGALPSEMTLALRTLEENLRMYKAYLPKTCLPFGETESSDAGSNLQESIVPSTESNVGVLRAQRLALVPATATLMVLNVKDSLCMLSEEHTCFTDLFTGVLAKTLVEMDMQRGMVDTFIGDRVHCSFNASRRCGNHAASALHTAARMVRASVCATQVNIGIATGKVLCGDMGCAMMRRFSMVGTLLRDVQSVERAGRVLGCDVLCNRICFSDAECEHQLRLVPCKVEFATGCVAVVAELITTVDSSQQQNLASSQSGNEWMYVIGGKKDWDDYNRAVEGYLKGNGSAGEIERLWVSAGGCGRPASAVPSGRCRVLCTRTLTEEATVLDDVLAVSQEKDV